MIVLLCDSKDEGKARGTSVDEMGGVVMTCGCMRHI